MENETLEFKLFIINKISFFTLSHPTYSLIFNKKKEIQKISPKNLQTTTK